MNAHDTYSTREFEDKEPLGLDIHYEQHKLASFMAPPNHLTPLTYLLYSCTTKSYHLLLQNSVESTISHQLFIVASLEVLIQVVLMCCFISIPPLHILLIQVVNGLSRGALVVVAVSMCVKLFLDLQLQSNYFATRSF